MNAPDRYVIGLIICHNHPHTCVIFRFRGDGLGQRRIEETVPVAVNWWGRPVRINWDERRTPTHMGLPASCATLDFRLTKLGVWLP